MHRRTLINFSPISHSPNPPPSTSLPIPASEPPPMPQLPSPPLKLLLLIKQQRSPVASLCILVLLGIQNHEIDARVESLLQSVHRRRHCLSLPGGFSGVDIHMLVSARMTDSTQPRLLFISTYARTRGNMLRAVHEKIRILGSPKCFVCVYTLVSCRISLLYTCPCAWKH